MGVIRDVGQKANCCFFCGQRERARGGYREGFDITGRPVPILICPFCIDKLGSLATEAWASSIEADFVINLQRPLSELEIGFLKGVSLVIQEGLRQITNNPKGE